MCVKLLSKNFNLGPPPPPPLPQELCICRVTITPKMRSDPIIFF